MKTKKQALVAGSIAFDVIFGIHGNIQDEIVLKDGKLNNVNMMFTAKGKQRYFGGTGGNIAYGLGLLNENPILFSVVGRDFDLEYGSHLRSKRVELRIVKKDDGYTATYYGISDEKYQQIGIWQPDVYGDNIEEVNLSDTLTADDFKRTGVAIFSPGTGISTRNHMKELREKNSDALIIFDPSQVLSIFYDDVLLKECLSLADVFIGNNTEVEQLSSIFGYSIEKVLKMGVGAVIKTRGGDGCEIYQDSGTTKVNAIKPKRLVETTGAGDAFRSGLIYGLLKNKSLIEACRIGSFMGAKNVEEYGGQIYQTSVDELNLSVF